MDKLNHQLVKYDAMVTAIAECEAFDEAKDIRDKAQALEAYYRQARNTEAERQAANVRLRAERRAGELLKVLARAQGARNDTLSRPVTKSAYAEALEETGMSRQQAHNFQALANVPEEDFEAALADPKKPSRAGVMRKVKAEPEVSDAGLWVWGRLRDFERGKYLEMKAQDLFAGMTETMVQDVLRLAPKVAEFLDQIGDDQ